MALQCKKCKKVTRKKKTGVFQRRPRCRGCGSFDFDDILDALVTAFDFEELLYFGEEGYDDFGMEVMAEGPVDVSEDNLVESPQESSPEPAYTPSEPDTSRQSSYGSDSGGYDSGGYDSGSSDSGSSDCGGCD